MNDSLLFQHYLVVFFDQLGQRDTLRKITDLPTSDAEKHEFIEVMKKSVGRVINIREGFQKYFDEAKSYTPNPKLVHPKQRKDFLATQNIDIKFYGISDAVIIAVPLLREDDNCTAINGIFNAFIATCGIGLLSLSIDVPMRAGLDVGIATKIDDNEIYGPALERAYYLESNLAEYPRFVVGQELVNYLFWAENKETTSTIGQVAKGLAKYCREFIIKDSDGRYILDFLGAKIKEASRGVIDKKIVSSALNYVTSQHEKYVKEGNDKLASRYYRLLVYFNSRKSIWGLD